MKLIIQIRVTSLEDPGTLCDIEGVLYDYEPLPQKSEVYQIPKLNRTKFNVDRVSQSDTLLDGERFHYLSLSLDVHTHQDSLRLLELIHREGPFLYGTTCLTKVRPERVTSALLPKIRKDYQNGF